MGDLRQLARPRRGPGAGGPRRRESPARRAGAGSRTRPTRRAGRLHWSCHRSLREAGRSGELPRHRPRVRVVLAPAERDRHVRHIVGGVVQAQPRTDPAARGRSCRPPRRPAGVPCGHQVRRREAGCVRSERGPVIAGCPAARPQFPGEHRVGRRRAPARELRRQPDSPRERGHPALDAGG